jgi:hypothetical protein
MGVACSMNRRKGNEFESLLEIPDGKRSRRRWEDYTKWDGRGWN